ncbi:MAG: DegQ family serine endoprotease [Pseudomonadota bacterium]
MTASSIALRGGLNPRAVWFAVLAGLLALAMLMPAQARPAPESFADLAEQLTPAVVNISTSQMVEVRRGRGVLPNLPPGSPLEEFFRRFEPQDNGQEGDQKEEREQNSLGSGFIIDPAGYIITNNHVIDGADKIVVTLSDTQEYDATLVGTDPETDVALLKIEASQPLPFVKFGESDKMRVGDWVIAIGNPFGLGGSVTAGILSARHRDIRSGPYDDYLQTDASINRGNSGGPMFNMAGEVIGINTAIFSPTGGNVGIGFAIPSSMVKTVAEQLRKYGKPRRAWLGVQAQSLTKDIAESQGLAKAKGAIVSTVNPEGPADKAGFKPGDIVIELDGTPVDDINHLLHLLARADIGRSVPVKILRDGKERILKVKLGERPGPDAQFAAATPGGDDKTTTSDRASILGMELRPVTPDMRAQMDLPGTVSGVAVLNVARNSDAGKKGLSPGDVIAQVNGADVTSPADVVAQVRQAEKQGRPTVLLRLFRQGSFFHTAVKIEG